MHILITGNPGMWVTIWMLYWLILIYITSFLDKLRLYLRQQDFVCLFYMILGVGKTTLVKKITENLAKSAILFDGFITEEVRNQSFQRTGFEARLLKSNAVAVLADKIKYGEYKDDKLQFNQSLIQRKCF